MLEEFDPEKHGSKAQVHLCEAEGLLLCEMLRGEADCLEWRPSSVPPSAFVRMLGKPVFSVGPGNPLTLLVGMEIGAVSMENSVDVP